MAMTKEERAEARKALRAAGDKPKAEKKQKAEKLAKKASKAEVAERVAKGNKAPKVRVAMQDKPAKEVIAAVIETAGKRGIKRSELTSKVSRVIGKDERLAAIASLIRADKVRVETVGGKGSGRRGRPCDSYYWKAAA